MWAELHEIFNKQFEVKFVKKFGKPIGHLTRIIILLVVISYFFQFSIVPSKSMLPTLKVNDYLLVYTRAHNFGRGDIIEFKMPLDQTQTYVKRVIGLPGDTIEVTNGTVYVSGSPLKENYEREKPDYTYPPTRIPPGEYFVLGDNRNDSFDSHLFGLVKQGEIRGRVVAVLLPIQRFHAIGRMNYEG